MKKMLWKDIFKSISKSKARFLSIMSLMLIGSFALVGLKVTGPNMRSTGENYFNELNVSDLTVIGTLGIDDNDVKAIDQTTGVRSIEYGYLKDVVIKDTKTSIRIFSKGEKISDYEQVSGKLPEKANEIALDNSYADQYKLGDTIEFTEKEDVSGQTILKEHKFKIVGFIYSGEIVSSINQGVSTAGTGSLNGYAIVPKKTFDSEIYMLARMTFRNLEKVDPYSDNYTDKLQKHKDDLSERLKNQPEIRLATIKKEYQGQIDDGQKQINQAKQQLKDTEQQLKDAKGELANGTQQIQDAQTELTTKVNDANEQITNGESQITTAQASIEAGEQQLATAQTQLADGSGTLNEKWTQLQNGKQQLSQARSTLTSANDQLTIAANALASGKEQLAAGYNQVNENQAKLAVAEAQITQAEQTLATKQQEYDTKNNEYQTALNKFNQQKQEYTAGVQQLQTAQTDLDTKKQELEAGKQQYVTTMNQLTDSKNELEQALKNPDLTEEEQAELQSKLDNVNANLSQAQVAYNHFIETVYTPGMQQIETTQQALNTKKAELDKANQKLTEAEQQLATSKQQLDAGAAELSAANAEIEQQKAALANAKGQLQAAQETLSQKEAYLNEKEVEYQSGLQQYNAGIASYNQNLGTYYAGLNEWYEGAAMLDKKSAEYQENVDRLAQVKHELATKQTELTTAKDTLATEQKEGEQQLADAKSELAKKQKEYEEKNQTFQSKKEEAEKEIAKNQEKLDKAQEMVDHLSLPTYSLNSRREIPGGEGYRIYGSISKIVDSLANVFPIFLYFVAALVTLTTMARFVDEERIKSGTLKALGYENKDVIRKFTFYGLTSSLSGTILGIILGHTLLPLIVYNAYHSGFTLPKIELHFHWGISFVAILLALISSVVPAFVVASRELKENPAQLLLPKPPSAGSKILLERIKPLWNRMSFTHKVTARNIFRYKQRMMMTIFGVAGAVALLFAGFSVQHSIGGINDRQFGSLIHYDMIVAQNEFVPEDQEQALDEQLSTSEIKQNKAIHYEELTKVAGSNKDTQEIKLIVPESTNDFSDYISLVDRKSGDKLSLPDDGVIISERLAKLLDVKTGDTVTFKDSNQKDKKMKVAEVTEMYMGHFAFTSKAGYENLFGTDFATNAYLVNLKNPSTKNTKEQAAKFINLDSVAGVVQNTTLMNQIDTIVHSLDKIMKVLIVVAALLGIVILYNLTNINVSERMRELSTIKVLGFYDKEVTLYIYRETILLTILGIITGFGIGELLHQYIINVVPPDDVMFNPALSSISFIIPTIIIAVVTTILAFVINSRLKRVDMLEALKSVD
ncbi:FtsX-like permease family protein [Enterococcus thailandicus]|uniref:FtsX-like permease family protein n=1 Tax=Enterococcus thailandicus TaxID=417368 RepID=UPI003984F12C